MFRSLILMLIGAALGSAVVLSYIPVIVPPVSYAITLQPNPPAKDPELLTHAQETWISALEWCESNGRPAAVNEIDRDGTASYYSFQFKPQTFRNFGEHYGVIERGLAMSEIMELMRDTDLQRSIVRGMVQDPSTAWHQQFPGCTLKLGEPPLY